MRGDGEAMKRVVRDASCFIAEQIPIGKINAGPCLIVKGGGSPSREYCNSVKS
jgi:hypothetical protein